MTSSLGKFLATLGVAALVSVCHCATYSIDDTGGLARRFDGVGGLSGGGATSKLLVNYPEKQRKQILDYLFLPKFGASLHILKVEIGGDAQSTDGTEASHMHNSWDENYQRGYEWWLMVEAKKRNPDILLYGLPWAFPGWIGMGTSSPFVDPVSTSNYIIKWIQGAQRYYNLTMDYIGIWNERKYNVTYIKTLRTSLDEQNLKHVQIVAADGGWEITLDVLDDKDLANDIGYIGVHYPGTLSNKDAIKTGKQLWASEDYSTFNDNTGGGCWARILNQNYVNGMMTATISWNLIASYYDNLPYYRDGLMTAVEPWGGNYIVESTIWMSAHTTQFTKPGWMYLPHGDGVGKLASGGSYVALTDKTKKQLTIVIETMSHNHSICIRPPLPKYTVEPQIAYFALGGSFVGIETMNVWYSKLGFDGNQSTFFQKMKPMRVVGGVVMLNLGLDEVYTLTTVMDATKGTVAPPPASQPFPLPYTDDFDDYSEHSEPNNFAQQMGQWEVVNVGPPYFGVIRQMVLQHPVSWCSAENINKTLNIIGSHNWTDVYVLTQAFVGIVNNTNGVYVAARVSEGGCKASNTQGLFFFLFPSENSYQLTNDLARMKVLSQGNVTANTGWNSIALIVKASCVVVFTKLCSDPRGTAVQFNKGKMVAGLLNEKPIFNITAPSMPASGFAGLGTDSFGLADFDHFVVAEMKNNDWSPEKGLHKTRDKDTLYFKGWSTV